MNRWMLLAGVGAATCCLVGCGIDRDAQKQAKQTAGVVQNQTPVVNVQPAKIESVADKLEVTGDIVTGADATVGPKQSGKIVAVSVKEGDHVVAGQVLAELDTSTLQAQLRQASAQVQTASAGLSGAMANLAEARRNLALGPAKSSAAVRSAEASLRSAQAQLQKAKAGARPEEILQDEAALRSAKSNLDTQQKELARVEKLVEEGALAANQLDTQKATTVAAQSQYDSAQQTLTLAKAGARPEDIVTANETVRQAQEALAQAKIQQKLDPLLQDQLDAAKAQVESQSSQLDAAKANVSLIEQNISDFQILAPFAGTIYGKPTQVGTVVPAGGAIARVIGSGGAYFNGDVPATMVDQVKAGMGVRVTIDGMPGRQFAGTVASVSPLGADIGRLFSARIILSSMNGAIKPGMFAHGVITLKDYPNATLVPVDAVVKNDGKSVVFYIVGQKAKSVEVKTGVQEGSLIQVTGLPAGVDVVVDGQSQLRDGVTVTVKKGDQTAMTVSGSTSQG